MMDYGESRETLTTDEMLTRGPQRCVQRVGHRTCGAFRASSIHRTDSPNAEIRLAAHAFVASKAGLWTGDVLGEWSYDADRHWLVFTEAEGASVIVAFDVPATWAAGMLIVLNHDDSGLALALRDWMNTTPDDRQPEDDLRDAAETWLAARDERGLLP